MWWIYPLLLQAQEATFKTWKWGLQCNKYVSRKKLISTLPVTKPMKSPLLFKSKLLLFKTWFRLASNSLYSKGDLEPLPCSPFWERVSLYNPGYPETCYTDQAGLESRDPPVPHQVHLSSVGMKGMRQHTQHTQPTLPTLKLVRGGNLCLWAMGFRYLPPHCIYELWGWSLSLYMCAEKLKSQDFKLKKLGCIARCDDTHL